MTVAVEQEQQMAEYGNDIRPIVPSDYGCEILVEDGTWEQVCTREAPNDCRIITYISGSKTCYDLTRGPKVSKIFDMYWDKYREGIKKIEFSQGRISPKLWGAQKQEKRKRK